MDQTNNVKAENANVMWSYNRLGTFAKLLRLLELFLVLFFLFWLSSRLPLTYRITTVYLHKLFAILFTPLSIFLVGNVIVFPLLAKSPLSNKNPENNLIYEELLSIVQENIVPVEKEVVYQDKKVVLEGSDDVAKVLRRSKSEDLEKKEVKFVLRRSEAEKFPGGDVAVREMSNEEFQKAIEEFIAKQVQFHKEEKLAIVLPVDQ